MILFVFDVAGIMYLYTSIPGIGFVSVSLCYLFVTTSVFNVMFQRKADHQYKENLALVFKAVPISFNVENLEPEIEND